jgi:hypothetical protein
MTDPIPVAKRLPGPDDCDACGRCWWFQPETDGDFPHWVFEPDGLDRDLRYRPTHWLPFHALPLPTDA